MEFKRQVFKGAHEARVGLFPNIDKEKREAYLACSSCTAFNTFRKAWNRSSVPFGFFWYSANALTTASDAGAFRAGPRRGVEVFAREDASCFLTAMRPS